MRGAYCLCKDDDCESISIRTWGDAARYADVRVCICCGGVRYEYYNARRCPNYRG